MAGRNHPMPLHQRQTLAGALPADPIAEVEQEPLGPAAVLVKHNGPATTQALPAERAATMTVVVPVGPLQSILGTELKRSRVVLCSIDKPFYYGTDRLSSMAAATAAAVWPANVPLVLLNADGVFLASADAAVSATVGIVIETWAD